jgi:hypothetical protein
MKGRLAASPEGRKAAESFLAGDARHLGERSSVDPDRLLEGA